jgi:ATP-dependent RNA helicase DDX5/DBP2
MVKITEIKSSSNAFSNNRDEKKKNKEKKKEKNRTGRDTKREETDAERIIRKKERKLLRKSEKLHFDVAAKNEKRKLKADDAADEDDDKKKKKKKKTNMDAQFNDNKDVIKNQNKEELDEIFRAENVGRKGNAVEDDDEDLIEKFVKEHHVTISDKNAPKPILSFDKMHNIFPVEIVTALKKQGYVTPTPIQAFSWTIALTGRDIVAIAKTGSGKTCSFLLPALTRIKKNGGPQKAPEMELVQGRWKPGPVKPTSIVLAPTRELAIQINDECKKFCPAVKAKCVCLYGGAAKGDQLRQLRGGADIVVATPGRLNDFLEPPAGFSAPVSASEATYVVLDEADRMLDMGFEPQIKKIIKLCPHARQTLFYSATWPKSVQKIAANFTTKPIQVSIGEGGAGKLTANKMITQVVQVCTEDEKFDNCMEAMGALEEKDTCIVFCGTKRRCDFLDRKLRQAGIHSCGAIHGDKDQHEREKSLDNFRKGKGNVLVATDVAARGLDIPGVAMVLIYDFPGAVEDYVHRIGRTGRAGKTGISHTLFTREDAQQARELVQIMQGADQAVPDQLQALVKTKGSGAGAGGRWGKKFGGGGGRGGGGGAGRGGFKGKGKW